jgi:hypothetical protein
MRRPEEHIVIGTASAEQYHTVRDFLQDVYEWCRDNGVEYEWQGEHSRTRQGRQTFYCDLYIPDDHQRTLFVLKWS